MASVGSGASIKVRTLIRALAEPLTYLPIDISGEQLRRTAQGMAEDFPEDKYDYKPHPDSRTFAANIIHACGFMYYLTDLAQGRAPRYPNDPKRDNLQTKAQIAAFVKKSVEDGAAAIMAKGDSGLNDAVDTGDSHLYRLYDLAYEVIEHSGEHYGQLVVYYRNNGLVPPESRPRK